jgi:two-component system copper resistance phosphate regulon response regulator CusR
MKPAASCLTADPAVGAFYRSALSGFDLRFYPAAAVFLKAPPAKGLVVIDSALPDMSGRDLAAVLRRERSTSRLLLVVTGASFAPAEAALCLENGADEYFPFPPDPRLFRARLVNLLGRSAAGSCAAAAPREYAFGELSVSPDARTASVGRRRLKLTALEFDILLYFLRNQGRVVSRSVLLEQVWRQDAEAGPRAVDKRIEAVRSALGRAYGSKLRTVFGLGYVFKL